MDRRLIGILAICVVFSTLFTLFIIGERSSGITLVENIYPSSVYQSRVRDAFPFQYGVVFRQNYASVVADFYTLRRAHLNVTVAPEDATLEGLAKLPEISTLVDVSKVFDYAPVIMTIGAERKNESVSIKLLDFSGIFDGFAPFGLPKFVEGARSGIIASPGATLAFAFVFNESGFIDYYEGVRDFFIERELLLSDMYIRLNDDVASFTSSRMSTQPVGQRILDAPKGGRLKLVDVERDDRLEVGFSVNSQWVPREGMRILQIMAIRGDLDSEHVQSNFVG
jgi:hypothetical protein